MKTNTIQPWMRWTVLLLLSFAVFCGYFIADVMAPLMDLLKDEMGWTATEYGIFNSAYGWLNVFMFMLIVSGIVLDRLGVRITGIGACALMVVGCGLKYYAISHTFDGEVFGLRTQLFLACAGFSIFALGLETSCIVVNKAIVRWFKGRQLALAMGIQVGIARIGTGLAMATTIPLAKYLQSLSAPILFGLVALCIGLLTFLVFCVIDRRLDATAPDEPPFRLSDLKSILFNRGFWMLSILCMLFYSAIFPFMKFATSLMVNKYGLNPDIAGNIPAILPLGTILLTPLFGRIYDKYGKAIAILAIGTGLLMAVHLFFALPLLNVWWFAAGLMIMLGMALSLVPSALWPAVSKIIPSYQLGTAYALIFWLQNIGQSMVPLLMGTVLDASGYNYSFVMLIFSLFGLFALATVFLLQREDRRRGYGLNLPNMN